MDWVALTSLALTTSLVGGVGFVLAFLIAIPFDGNWAADVLMAAAVALLCFSLALGVLLGTHAIWT